MSMLTTDVPSVGFGELLLACESRHTAGLGLPLRPGGDIRDPDAALNGEAGRGAGMSRTSGLEYATPVPGFAASYVGGWSPEFSLYVLSGE